MSDSQTPREPPLLKATELFPDLDHDIDRRIAYSESRIKFWVIAGVLANLLIAIGAGVPMVYYLGQSTEKFSRAMESVQTLASANDDTRSWRQRREIWESAMESWAEDKGFKPPRLSKEDR